MTTINIDVDIEDFDDDEVIERAKTLGLYESLEEVDDFELIAETEKRGFTFVPNTYYPNNDIVSQDLIKRFVEGFGKLDKVELESFLTKFGA